MKVKEGEGGGGLQGCFPSLSLTSLHFPLFEHMNRVPYILDILHFRTATL